MGEVFLDALIDSLKILAVLVICNFLIALIEPKLSQKIKMRGRLAPLIGVSVALLPQCGFSIVATDLYQKKHITIGTLIGVYLATSDEALPIFLSNPKMALHILPMLAIKFALGLVFGYTLDFIFTKKKHAVEHHLAHCNDKYQIRLTHCDGAMLEENIPQDLPKVEDCDCEDCKNSHEKHSHQDAPKSGHGILYDINIKQEKQLKKRANIKRFVVHPLLHSAEIFLYVLVINILFGIVIYFIGEDSLTDFLLTNKYIAPLFAVFVGAIPNCASSIVLSELYMMGGLGFGAALGGLCMNAGMGFMMLFKDTKHAKQNVGIFFLMMAISILVSYVFSLIFSFAPLKI